MTRLSVMVGLLVAGLGWANAGGSGAPLTASPLVTFRAKDGLTVYANYTPGPQGAPLILLFHKAESNKGEYQEIAKRLKQMGYATLAVDARSGAATYAGERRNLTADAYEKKAGTTAGFEEAYPDLEAALAWAKAKLPDSKLLVMGSSYSANLVFRLAADHPQDVSAVMSFSPYVSTEIMPVLPKVKSPAFLTSAGNPTEIEAAQQMLQALGSASKVQYRPANGPHGAEAALTKVTNRSSEDYWQALTAFLKTLK